MSWPTIAPLVMALCHRFRSSRRDPNDSQGASVGTSSTVRTISMPIEKLLTSALMLTAEMKWRTTARIVAPGGRSL